MDMNSGLYVMDEISDHDSGMAVDLQDGTHVVKVHATPEQMKYISDAIKEKRRRQAKAARKSRRRNR